MLDLGNALMIAAGLYTITIVGADLIISVPSLFSRRNEKALELVHTIEQNISNLEHLPLKFKDIKLEGDLKLEAIDRDCQDKLLGNRIGSLERDLQLEISNREYQNILLCSKLDILTRELKDRNVIVEQLTGYCDYLKSRLDDLDATDNLCDCTPEDQATCIPCKLSRD